MIPIHWFWYRIRGELQLKHWFAEVPLHVAQVESHTRKWGWFEARLKTNEIHMHWPLESICGGLQLVQLEEPGPSHVAQELSHSIKLFWVNTKSTISQRVTYTLILVQDSRSFTCHTLVWSGSATSYAGIVAHYQLYSINQKTKGYGVIPMHSFWYRMAGALQVKHWFEKIPLHVAQEEWHSK